MGAGPHDMGVDDPVSAPGDPTQGNRPSSAPGANDGSAKVDVPASTPAAPMSLPPASTASAMSDPESGPACWAQDSDGDHSSSTLSDLYGEGPETGALHETDARGAGITNPGRSGGQQRLRELADDDKVSSALRGWIKNDQRQIASGNIGAIRRPPGHELAHERGREAEKGYSYKHSNLQEEALHDLQHKHDDFGRKNKERPLTDEELNDADKRNFDFDSNSDE